MRHLIEVVHLTDHPSERAALVRALGATEQTFVEQAVLVERGLGRAVNAGLRVRVDEPGSLRTR